MLHDPVGRNRSPYLVSVFDLICRFGTSPTRCDILRGFVRLRHALFQNSFTGFQWIGGSFVENLTDREPNDIDVVSFIEHHISPQRLKDIAYEDMLISKTGSKKKYCCDSYIVDVSLIDDARYLINDVTYWYSIFSHTRNNIWKGMLRLELAESRKEQDFFMALIDWRQNHEPDC